jgi:hypothetical protein
MDVGTIPTALVVVGAFALLGVLLRRLPPAEDDVATVVAAVLGTPVELGRPSAGLDEPVRWRLDQLNPRAADRSPFERSTGSFATDRRVPRLTTRPHSPASRA